ncbi:MAG TPA: glycosyltransferase, partial [Actinomycetaceae bacterium]|nr:glycosyltransferase [Actinomycetaceae bacterium]
MSTYSVVLPTVGRPSLTDVLTDLHRQSGPAPQEVIVVDDRPLVDTADLELPDGAVPVRVLRSGGRGPAAARNAGWRTAATEWVAFLDDDVRLPADWSDRLAADLAAAEPDVGASQGRISVPLPAHRRPTDWERNTAGLETALWATADMAYRRAALAQVHGFDERFPRAFREDADLALRVSLAGWRLTRGEREIVHPARPADAAVSLRMQAGAASDALMRALHGPGWRAIGGTGRGRFRWHVATVAAGTGALALAAGRRRRAALAAAAAWAGLTADFAVRRVAPGPRPGEEGWAGEWG